MNKKQKQTLWRILASAALLLLFYALPIQNLLGGYLQKGLLLIPYFLVGYDILKKAFKSVKNRQPFDENFLMAVATIGAILLGEMLEGVAVMLFYQIGELFQSYAVGKSRKNISALMDIRPDYAHLEKDGEIETVDPDEVELGSIIVIQPGEKVPIDGIVVEGSSYLNTSALTGESVPRAAAVGSEVLSGCINERGLLRVRTVKEFDQSTASRILELMESASMKKSRSENFITKFARIYTPLVCYSALALALVPPLVRLLMQLDPLWLTWIRRALTFLVISCPCALVISIPLSFFAGIGGASRQGILIKGSVYLESLSQTKTVAFDKTGTMTKGVFEVSGIHHSPLEDAKLLEKAALAELFSSHPISQSLQKAYAQLSPERPLDQGRVADVEEISGQGVLALVDGERVAVGNERLMEKVGAKAHPCHSLGTVVHVAVDGAYQGHILISDQLKEEAMAAVADLKKAGVMRIAMLTGDSENVAAQVAKSLEIPEHYSELLPQDKVSLVEKMLEEKPERSALAFVGDGINDAPVLSMADVGIAMGALGSDAAIEAADVVLMDDNPSKIARAIRLAKKCMRIVYENIYFAIGIKVLCLILGAFGIANMWLAIFADVGVMVLAVLNALRSLAA